MKAVFDFWDEVNLEDVEATERVQTGQRVATYTGGPFSQFEVMIHRMQRMLVECVTHDWEKESGAAPVGAAAPPGDYSTNQALRQAPFAPFYDPAVCKEALHYNDMRHH